MIAERDQERFLRQIIIDGFGENGQERLSRGRGKEMRFSELAPARNPRCPHCGDVTGGRAPRGG